MYVVELEELTLDKTKFWKKLLQIWDRKTSNKKINERRRENPLLELSHTRVSMAPCEM